MKITPYTTITELFEAGFINGRAYHCCLRAGFSTVDDIDNWQKKGKDFKTIKMGGLKFEKEMEALLAQTDFDAPAPGLQMSIPFPESTEEELFLQSFCNNRTETKDHLLMCLFFLEEEKCSVRTQNEINMGLQTIDDVVKALAFGADRYIKIGNKKSKTFLETKELFERFKSVYDQVMLMNPSEAERRLVGCFFPFIQDIFKKIFVQRFKMAHGYYPVLFLLQEYLNVTQDQNLCIIADYYGIGNRKVCMSLQELANKYSLSKERCRQIVYDRKKTKLVSKVLKNDFVSLIDGYHLMNMPFSTGCSEVFKMMVKTEGIKDDFYAFCGLMNLLDKHEVRMYNGKPILVSEEFSEMFGPEEMITHIESVINEKRIKDLYYSINDLITNRNSEEQHDVAVMFVRDVLAWCYEIVSDEENIVCLDRNAMNYPENLYDILNEKGSPMTVDEIYEVFCIKYPEIVTQTPGRIRANLLRNDKITALGKTSTYALKEWGIFNGTITDYLYEILSSSSVPCHINDIERLVVDQFPATNIKSIISLLSMNPDVVPFEGDLYGLEGKEYLGNYVIDKRKCFTRKNFGTRFEEYKTFVEKYKRFPLSTGDEENEQTLFRWEKNVNKGSIEATNEQLNSLVQFQTEHDTLPKTATEWYCWKMCRKMEEYLQTLHRIPSKKEDTQFVRWYNVYVRNYHKLGDKRDAYILDALKNSKSGFDFDESSCE